MHFSRVRRWISFVRLRCSNASNFSTTAEKGKELAVQSFYGAFEDECSRHKIGEIVGHFNSLQGHENLPSTLTVENVKYLLSVNDFCERERYFHYLYVTEKKKETEKREKQLRKLRKGTEHCSTEFPGLKLHEERGYGYGLWRNSMFTRLNDQMISNAKKSKLLSASIFGQKLVFDFSFEQHMCKREIDSLCNQLLLIHSSNCDADYPFDVWYIDYHKSSYYDQRLTKLIPTLANQLIHLESKSLLDLFPRESLVYLSPDAETVLWNYDHNAVYVIGCLVDTVNDSPITFNKCKDQNIQCVRLPLDECVEWYAGNKDLPLNQVFDVLMKLKTTNNWRRSIKKVASRKWTRVKKEDEILQAQQLH